jgi:hypothetical protein
MEVTRRLAHLSVRSSNPWFVSPFERGPFGLASGGHPSLACGCAGLRGVGGCR